MGISYDRSFWKAAILVIGNEILIGRVLDTNSQKIAKMLTMIGYDVVEIRKVRDDIDAIANAIRELMLEVNVIITTGGLGPTYDDVTAEALAYAIGSPVCLNEEALNMIVEKLKKMGILNNLDKNRKKMAILPCVAEPLPNPVGVAPGIYVQMARVKIFSLPGVPQEMEAILEKYVIPILEKEGLMVKREACETLEDVREADIAPIIEEYAKERPEVYIKTHPSVKDGVSVVKICVLASGESSKEAEERAKTILKNLISRILREYQSHGVGKDSGIHAKESGNGEETAYAPTKAQGNERL